MEMYDAIAFSECIHFLHNVDELIPNISSILYSVLVIFL